MKFKKWLGLVGETFLLMMLVGAIGMIGGLWFSILKYTIHGIGWERDSIVSGYFISSLIGFSISYFYYTFLRTKLKRLLNKEGRGKNIKKGIKT